MDNKGFTLIELLATIIILTLVMGISTYSVVNIINKTKEENYKSLLMAIKDGSETYYQECKYANNSGISCDLVNGSYEISIGDLVKYGYVKGDNNNNVIDPKNDNEISSCIITVTMNNGMVLVNPASGSAAKCPTSY